MRWHNVAPLAIAVALGLGASSLWAQGPGGFGGNQRGNNTAEDMIARLMKMDADQDGQLSKDEVTDRRLMRLFVAADTDKDEVLTTTELQTYLASQAASAGRNQRGQGGPGGQGGQGMGPGGQGMGPGGPGGGMGPGGPGGPGGGMMTPPRVGEVMPSFVAQMLNLTAEQKAQLAALQQKVDAELAAILTDEQEAQCAQMSQGGPGGQGMGPGGPRGQRGQR
ncbi:hypothetical protein [Blastopirellula marina]|uniref:hypothetical protein n=1 Tax=Blastopirellula marina TaxID=124 RepID=UPI0013049B4B|nr:hypothetical protein [Blastopirellula marina]